MNVPFLIAALVLVVLSLLGLLRPWKRAAASSRVDAKQINTTLYREQLSDLDQELASGGLSAADHEVAKVELERRLLEDVRSAATEPTVASSLSLGWKMTSTLVLVLSLAAAGIYKSIGSMEALDPVASGQGHEIGNEQIAKMVASLAAKLEKQPDDPKGWAMLGRSYHAMGRMADAAKAIEHIGPSLQQDPVMLAIYADVLGSLNNGELAGRPSELIGQALAVDAQNPMALELAATAANQRHDVAGAIGYWEQLTKLLPPDSEDGRWVQSKLDEMRGGRAGVGAGASAVAAAQPASSSAPVGDSSLGVVGGHVSISAALASKVQPDDTLFIFARANDGSRMPLAIRRLRANQLPIDFQLDDSLAMSPQAKLSGASKVIVEARVSHKGEAMPASGDLFGVSPVIVPGGKELVRIVIDQIRP